MSMIANRLAVWFMALCLCGAAWAETPLDRVRGLLDAGDVAGLEQELAQLHARAQETGDVSDLRLIHTRLFATTHPDRQRVIAQWLAASPTSPYAASAEAWAAIHVFDLLSGAERGYTQLKKAYRFDDWRAARERALRAIPNAVLLSQEAYVPALDAWFEGFAMGAETEFLGQKIASLAELVPGPDTGRIVLEAGLARAPVPSREAVVLCLQLGEVIAGYSADACLLDAAMARSLGNDLQAQIDAVIAATDDPRYDSLRLTMMLRDGQGTSKTWQDLHRGALKPGIDFDNYMLQARNIARKSDQAGYTGVAAQNVIAMLDTLLADDPFNHRLLAVKARLLNERYYDSKRAEDLAAARAAWEGMLVYADGRSDTWRLGAYLAAADRDPSDFAAIVPFWHNAIAHSHQSRPAILEFFFTLNMAREVASARQQAGDGAEPEPDAVLEALKCPMLRAARTADALCRIEGAGDPMCSSAHPFYKPVPDVLAAGRAGSCPAIQSAGLSDLRYAAIPAAQVVLPWQGASD